MKRTRKWSYVAQEAERLAGLGVAPKDIGARLGVNRSSITRWMKAGKLKATTARPYIQRAPQSAPPPRPPKTATEWAQDIRSSYDLDATDDQLVTVAEGALALSLDPASPANIRLQAAGRFQSLVKQLALVARHAKGEQPVMPATLASKKNPTIARPAGDPRKLLAMVSR